MGCGASQQKGEAVDVQNQIKQANLKVDDKPQTTTDGKDPAGPQTTSQPQIPQNTQPEASSPLKTPAEKQKTTTNLDVKSPTSTNTNLEKQKTSGAGLNKQPTSGAALDKQKTSGPGLDKQKTTVDVKKPASIPSFAKPIVIFVLGGPGSGKMTQCDRIRKEFGLVHLTTGFLLADEKASGSDLGKTIGDLWAQKKPIPSDLVVGLLKREMEYRGWGKNQFLIDGFPRNQENCEVFKSMLGETVDLKFVINYDCPQEVMEKRVLEKGKTSGKQDEATPEAAKKKVADYMKEVEPVVAFYEKAGLVRHIDSNRGVEDVFKDTEQVFAQFKQFFPNQGRKNEAIFLIGGPGSGKHTQIEKIAVDYPHFVKISVPDELQIERKKGTVLAKEIDTYMQKGIFVPAPIAVKVLKRGMAREPPGTTFLIDGFPRNAANLEEWDKIVGNKVDVKLVLYFECMMMTLEKRWKQKCPSDSADFIKRKINIFQNDTIPIVGTFDIRGILKKLDAEKDADWVYEQVKKAIEDRGNNKK